MRTRGMAQRSRLVWKGTVFHDLTDESRRARAAWYATRVVDINALRTLAPLPCPRVPSPSGPQARTPLEGAGRGPRARVGLRPAAPAS
jgi:hypothetical protein